MSAGSVSPVEARPAGGETAEERISGSVGGSHARHVEREGKVVTLEGGSAHPFQASKIGGRQPARDSHTEPVS